MIDERKNLKFQVFCKYICSVLNREVRVLKYFGRSQSSPSCLVVVKINYSSDTISRLNFKKKN